MISKRDNGAILIYIMIKSFHIWNRIFNGFPNGVQCRIWFPLLNFRIRKPLKPFFKSPMIRPWI